MTPHRTISSPRARAAAPRALATACGLALASPVAAQLGEPFPPVFELESLLPARGGDGSLGFVVEGAEEYALLGASVDSAGDINGDGVDDVLIGAPGYTYEGYYPWTPAEGRAYVIFGRDQAARSFPALLQVAAMTPDDGIRFERSTVSRDSTGWSVAGLGDMNGDGQDDIAIAAEGKRETVVVFGADGSSGPGLAPVIELGGLDPEEGFTIPSVVSDVNAAGDVNGDSVQDLAIRDWRSESNYIVFGRHGGGFPARLHPIDLDGTNGFELLHTGSLGAAAAAGDVNADGVTDLIVGDWRADTAGGTDAGSTYIVYGRDARGFAPDEWVSNLISAGDAFRADGAAEDDRSGVSVSRAGDVNGDGIADFVIGASGALSTGYFADGKVYVVFGRDSSGPGFPAVLPLSTLNGENGFLLRGPFRGHAGTHVASAGDLNNDGFDDLVVAAFGAWESYVVYGRDTTGGSPFPASIELGELRVAEGFRIKYHESAALRAAGAGDVNGDGVDDLVLGAPYRYDPYSLGSGHAYIIFGRMPDAPCYADCDGSGDLDFFDFLCFQNQFAAGDPLADCDDSGVLDFFDFLCFQNAFAAGCP